LPPPALSRSARFAGPGITVMLAIAVTLLTATAWSLRSEPTDAAATRMSVAWPVQVTTHPGLDLTPALSPKGDEVAYASERSGSWQIWVRGLSGESRDTPLTADDGENVQPAWSPDGGRIAYHSLRHGGIWVIPARGGAPTQLAPMGSDPEWSPDARRLVFQSDELTDVAPAAFGALSSSTLWVVDADGANLRQVTSGVPPLGGHASPAWSRDGRWIAFTVFDGGRHDHGIWLVNLESGKSTPLYRARGLYEIAFSADGSVIYASGGEALIHRIPFDAETGAMRGEPRLIPIAGVSSVRGMSASAQRGRVAFAGLALSSQIWGLAVARDGSPRAEPYAISRDTSRRNSMPAVSPDGTRIAYMSRRAGDMPNVWVGNVDGTDAIQASADEGADMRPYWFPDNRRLAFMSTRGRQDGIFTVDLTTRRETPLVRLDGVSDASSGQFAGGVVDMALSPSASLVALGVVTPPASVRQLYVTPVATFSPRPLTDRRTWVGYPAWSPDERQLAVEIKDGGSTHAGIVDVASGAIRQLTAVRGQTWVRSWSPDGRLIAAAAMRDGRWSLRAIDAVSGDERVMMAPLPPNVYVRYPDWSPRGDLVVFERGELKGNIWIVTLDADAADQRKTKH
jgi:Tol biopolymer transport system component